MTRRSHNDEPPTKHGPPTNHEPIDNQRDSIDSMSGTTLTIADVERIAALAHLELTDEEKPLFARQLTEILHYAEQIQALNTSDVAGTAHVHAHGSAERDDEPRSSLTVAQALANAPDADLDAGLFRVPRVIGG